jgi:hypothetical protein
MLLCSRSNVDHHLDPYLAVLGIKPEMEDGSDLLRGHEALYALPPITSLVQAAPQMHQMAVQRALHKPAFGRQDTCGPELRRDTDYELQTLTKVLFSGRKGVVPKRGCGILPSRVLEISQ